ncbi:LysR family transcriptional regulator [Streptosporangium sp. CA-135522]|uniref:LysR family transcriptional regulator n=1 Tax=Streptosporangium sp. CA-135522 TaxID=3240072 RepID=UPI003D8DE903
MLERHEIEAFLTLAEELHFGHTAERLHVTTARVSQTIKKLERLVGVPLFERTSRRVTLTPIGRKLHEDLQPAYAQVVAGVESAINAGRGISGMLRVGFVGAAAGQLLLEAVGLFGGRHPECRVLLREVQTGESVQRLRAGEIELLIACFPIDEPDITMGSALLVEPRMLAVSSRHPFARRTSVSVEDLARDKILRAPCSIPEHWRDPEAPSLTPEGRPVTYGQAAETFQEVLMLVSAGQGVFPVGEQANRYYARPDIAYVPFRDAPPLEWGPLWLTTSATGRVRAFTQAAHDAVQARGGPQA